MVTLVHSCRLVLMALTAFMTLVAGLPRLRCDCIPGVPRALSFLQGVSSVCCCGPATSAPAPQSLAGHDGAKVSQERKSQVPPCCRRHKLQSQHPDATGSQFHSHCCRKTFQQGDVFTVSHHQASSPDEGLAVPVCLLTSVPILDGMPAHLRHVGYVTHPPGPAADLVTLLQRLTI
jgi:hypothetical protein